MRKKLLSILAFVAISTMALAQSPESFKYQSVIRDASLNIIPNQSVGMRLTILQGSTSGTVVYQETFNPTTNAYGLVNLEIGTGTVVSGTFSAIDWSMGPYFFETALDASGGTNYVVMGASELLSVPYALYSKTAENVVNDMVNDGDTSSTNEIQAISLSNDTLYLSNGGSIFLGAYATDNVNDGDTLIGNEYNTMLMLNGDSLEITDGGGTLKTDLSSLINDADADSTNELQTLSLSGDTLSISNGNNVVLPTSGGPGGNWTLSGANIFNSNTGNVAVGFNNPRHTFAVGRSDTTTALALGYVGSFNNVHSGKLVFSEDLSFNGDCGLMFQHNGSTNNLHLIGGCTTFGDTIARFNRNGTSNLRQLRIGTNILNNATNQLSVDGNADFTGNVTITGNLNITGNIAKGSGTFKIDHPLDPENKYLVHSFVESPEMMNVYSGNITTDANGYATVVMPDYFEAANKDFRYQLTVIGSFAQAIIKEKVANNQFKIQTNQPNTEVSWQVTSVRADKFANQNRIVPVVEKEIKGTYIHPELYGQSKAKSENVVKAKLEMEKAAAKDNKSADNQ